MGVESKIRELLEGKLQDDAVEVLDELAANRPLDKSSNGDAKPPLQGNSNPNPEQQDLSGSSNPEGGLTSPVGKEASAKAGSAPRPSNSGAGKAPNYNDGEATQSVVAQASSKGNVHQEEVEETEDEVLEETPVSETEEEIVENEAVEGEEVEYVDGEEEVIAEEEQSEVEASEEDSAEETLFEADIASLFADEEHLSEEFKTQAASLFEAVVVSRVNEQVQSIEDVLVEEANVAFDEAKEKLVENIDKYLSYVTEQWMSENELAIEGGLRNEITESFIKSLQQVFTEHYIDVPEEKFDVLNSQKQEIDELKSKLDEEIGKSVAISEDREQLQKERIFRSVVDDLAETEVEKFAGLVEGISYDSDDKYTSKLNVIKENYFPKAKADDSDKLEDSVDQGTLSDNSVMSRYVTGISQAAKFDRVKN
tara:strand:- start:339 stop:1610 length:1272 start_codon:yes stop_codon:yes gene_type:complete